MLTRFSRRADRPVPPGALGQGPNIGSAGPRRTFPRATAAAYGRKSRRAFLLQTVPGLRSQNGSTSGDLRFPPPEGLSMLVTHETGILTFPVAGGRLQALVAVGRRGVLGTIPHLSSPQQCRRCA